MNTHIIISIRRNKGRAYVTTALNLDEATLIKNDLASTLKDGEEIIFSPQDTAVTYSEWKAIQNDLAEQRKAEEVKEHNRKMRQEAIRILSQKVSPETLKLIGIKST